MQEPKSSLKEAMCDSKVHKVHQQEWPAGGVFLHFIKVGHDDKFNSNGGVPCLA